MKALKKFLRALPILAAVLLVAALAASSKAGLGGQHHHPNAEPYVVGLGGLLALELLILWATRDRKKGQRQPSQQAAWPGYGYPQSQPARRGRR